MANVLTPDVTIYRGLPTTSSYAWSPFVTKLEARLRFAGVTYTKGQGSPIKAPRGKIPYADISSSREEKSARLGDSQLIIKHLVETSVLEDLQAGLSPIDRARDAAIQAMMEDKLYFYQVHERWIQNYHAMRDGIFGLMSYPLQVIVGQLAYRQVTRTLHGQGTTRFTDSELSDFRHEIWEHINALLVESSAAALDPNRPFWILGGSAPSAADATVFGFIASGINCPAAPETDDVMRSFPMIIDYARRIHSKYFLDYGDWEEVRGKSERMTT